MDSTRSKVDLTYNRNITEFIGHANGAVIHHTSGDRESWTCVIGEDNQLILHAFVTKDMNTLLDIRGKDPIAHGMKCDDLIRHILNEANHNRSS